MFAKSNLPSETARLRQVEVDIAYLKDLMLGLYQHLQLDLPEPPRTEGDPRVVQALREGKLIEAIKVYREITGAGLADAKRDVEALASRLGLR